MTDRSEQLADLPSTRSARRWLGLSLVVLVLAGLCALAVVLGRMPPFDRYVTDPLFFKRCLAAHVNLALVAWFYSFLAALLFLLPGRGAGGWLPRSSVYIAGAGIAMLVVGAALPGSRPVLSNYIPTIDNALFKLGQLVFGLGVLGSLLDPGMFRRGSPSGHFLVPDAARSGLRAAAVGLGLAALTFATAWANQPSGVRVDLYYELLVWGGGHVLQLVCTLAMVAVWLTLLTQALDAAPVGRGAAAALFSGMLLPWTLAPWLVLQGTGSSTYRDGFTQLMQWCIFPPVCVFLILCAAALRRAWRAGHIRAGALADLRISAFLVSAALTLVGFGLGAAIRGSNTMIPAHYHASIGAVTVAFMAATYSMLAVFGRPIATRRLRRAAAWQPLLYGGGMLVFACGFALAGAYGMGRKVYGAEQAARGMAESVGLGLMGLGGFVAIAGGLLFLVIVGIAWWQGVEERNQPETMLSESSWRWRFGAQKSG